MGSFQQPAQECSPAIFFQFAGRLLLQRFEKSLIFSVILITLQFFLNSSRRKVLEKKNLSVVPACGPSKTISNSTFLRG